jgi:hypothetical protein
MCEDRFGDTDCCDSCVECIQCGKDFKPVKKYYTDFCSTPCAVAYRADDSVAPI